MTSIKTLKCGINCVGMATSWTEYNILSTQGSEAIDQLLEIL